tara:strand:- start:893 stop:2647 length:1755 start_codon:yes stop_codon:yes gene_type:complete
MTPNSGNNAGLRKGLLASARGTKEPKRPPKYRRGGVANSGASLQPPRPDPNAGRQQREDAKFLGQMQEFIFGKGMVHEQYREAERERGIASFEKASPEQREGFRDAISNGWIDSKESPYFREEVTKLHTKALLTTTSLDLYTSYEKWEGKNDPSPGAFDAWLEEQDQKSAINLENIPDSILADHFYEPHQAIKRQLAQQHAGYLNKEYRDKANAQADLHFNGLMNQYSEAMGIDLGSDPNMTVAQILKKQGITQEQAWRVGGLLKTVPKSGDNVGIMPKESLRQLELMAKNEGGIAANALYHYNGTDAETLRYNDNYEIPYQQSEVGREIARIVQIVTPEADADTIGNFVDTRLYSEHNNLVLQQQAESFNNVMASTATISEDEMRDAPTGIRNVSDIGMHDKVHYGGDTKEVAHISKEHYDYNTKKPPVIPVKVTRLSDSMKKVLNPEKSVANTMKVATNSAIKNIDLGAKDKDGKYVVAGGNSETMLDRVMEEGLKDGAHADWFKQLNVGGKGGIPKDTLLAISHAFFDEHHAGLLNKTKGAWKGRRTVTSLFKKTKVNETAFVSFTENHPLFEPYKKSTGS